MFVSRTQKRTYVRSTIRREAITKARYPKNYNEGREKKYRETVIPQTGRLGRGGWMLTNWKEIRTCGLWRVRAWAYIEQFEESIYLAIVSARRVHTEQANYHSQESGHARDRV